MRGRLATLAVIVGLGAAALADEVKKRDGTVLEGEIVEETPDAVTIRGRAGEVAVLRSDVASMTRGPWVDVEGRVAAIRSDTMAELAKLAKDAREAKKIDDAREIEALLAEVRAWAPKLARAQGGKRVDYRAMLDVFEKTSLDPKATVAARGQAVEALRVEFHGRPCFLAVTVEEVRGTDGLGGPGMAVTGQAGAHRVTVVFRGAEDKKKLLDVKKGQWLDLGGTVEWRAGNPTIKDAFLKAREKK